MKILLVGPTDSFCSEASYARVLRQRGCDVARWDNRAPSLLFGRRCWWEMSRAERAAYDLHASLRFYLECKRVKPEVIFFPKPDNIHSLAVRRALDETSARLVVWYPDHPFKSDLTSMNVLRDLKRCDLFYIWGRFLIEPLRTAGCRRVEYLPFAYDAEMHPADLQLAEDEQARFRSEIVFVGTWDAEREATLTPLAEFDLAIWGPYWNERVPAGSPLQRCVRGPGLYGAQMVKAFKGARVVFNQLRLHNGSAHNMRTMETTGSGGGVMLVRRTPEQSCELFDEASHFLAFDDADEMRTKARWALDHPADAARMAAAARSHVLEHHRIEQRIDQILEDLGAPHRG